MLPLSRTGVRVGLLAAMLAASPLVGGACGRVGYDPLVIATGDAAVDIMDRMDLRRDGGETSAADGPEADAAADSTPDSPAAPDGPMGDGAPPDLPASDMPPADVDFGPGVITGVPLCGPVAAADDVIAHFEGGAAIVEGVGGRVAGTFTIVLTGAGTISVPPPRTSPLCGSLRWMMLSARNIAPGKGHVQGRLRMAPLMVQDTFDARAYSGVQVSLRADHPLPVSLKLPDRNTVSSLPYNHYAATLAVTTEWRVFTVRWTDVRKDGGPRFDPLDVRALYAVELQALVDTNFDLHVDDIVFLR